MLVLVRTYEGQSGPRFGISSKALHSRAPAPLNLGDAQCGPPTPAEEAGGSSPGEVEGVHSPSQIWTLERRSGPEG